MPVVVTGAAGFIGGALTAALAGAGQRVIAVDRRAVPVTGGAVRALRVDLLDLGCRAGDDLATALREADAVFHLAGRPGVRDRDPDAERLRQRDNVLATERVLRHVPAEVPLVVTSSSSVYGGCHGRASREGDPLRPLGGYARSKARAEALCAARLASGGTVALARPFTVVGEGQRPDMALARWIAALRCGEPIRVLGSPARTRDVTDVREVVRSLCSIAERGVRGPVNIGTGRPRTLADLAAAVCRALGRPGEIVVDPVGHEEPAATRADTTLHETLLGFRPRTDLDDVVRRQVAASAPPVAVAGTPC